MSKNNDILIKWKIGKLENFSHFVRILKEIFAYKRRIPFPSVEITPKGSIHEVTVISRAVKYKRK